MAAKKTHEGPHRYERVKINTTGNIYFKCNLVGCPHYLKREFARGRLTLCHRCGKEFPLDGNALNLKQPHCEDCIERKGTDNRYAKILELLSQNSLENLVPDK